ncbi:hypothetical protein HK097_003846 [Rhizophlyctis rosea]|uniref:Uncharacterized protein n=1 Tax=Rhizophlyctis rosea TaxID=64517 RepID=A0AAD5S2W3_9FUNG|nr:hypothetical protein HK097_003846 [Rhizophlyctis rosea]
MNQARKEAEKSLTAYHVPTEAEVKKAEKRERRNAQQRASYAKRKAFRNEVRTISTAAEHIADLNKRAEKISRDFFNNPEPAPPMPHDPEFDHERWDPVRERVAQLKIDKKKEYHYFLYIQCELGKIAKGDGQRFTVGIASDIQSDYDFHRNVPGSQLENHILDFCVKWEGDGYVIYDIIGIDIDLQEVQKDRTQKSWLREQLQEPRRDFNAPILAVSGVNQNRTEDGTCGVALARSCGIKESSLKKAEEKIGDVLEKENTTVQGLSVLQMHEMAVKEGRSHIVIGVGGKILFKRTARDTGTETERRSHRKALCYYAVGKHFYPIEDPALRQRLANAPDTVDICSLCGKESPFDPYRDFCHDDTCGGELDISRESMESRKQVIREQIPRSLKQVYCKPIKVVNSITSDEIVELNETLEGDSADAVVIVNGQALDDIIGALYAEKNILVDSGKVKFTKLSYIKNGLTRRRLGVASFHLEHVSFQYNPQVTDVMHGCRMLNIPFNGQTPMLLLMDLFKYKLPEAKTTVNEWTKKWWPNDHLALNKVFRYEECYDASTVSAYDCKRSYENSCRMKQLPWAVFHSADFPTRYNGEANPISALLPGVYYVRFAEQPRPLWMEKLHDRFPDRYYHHEFLLFAWQHGARFDIEEQILAESVLPAKCFDEMFDQVYRAFPDALAKCTIREFIGLLNKRTARMYTVGFSNQPGDLRHSFLCRGPVQAMGSSGLHRGLTYDERYVAESYVPIYQQVIEQGWINVIQLAMCVDPERWIMMKTDEVVVAREHAFDRARAEELKLKYTTEDIDEAKAERLLKFAHFPHTHRIPEFVSVQTSPESFKWKELDPEMWQFKGHGPYHVPSLMVEGEGGTGKSEGMKKFIRSVAGGAVIVTASTHKAALIIGGKTIHSALYFDSKSVAFLIQMTKPELANVSYVVVDEAGMLAWYIINALLKFKMAHPHIRFIVIIDPLQLPPVEHRMNNLKRQLGQQVAERVCRKAKQKQVVLKGRDKNGEEKTLWLFKTARLYATDTVRGGEEGKGEGGGYVNQEDYRVMAVEGEAVKMHSLTRSGKKHIIEGDTITEPYTIHRWDRLQPWDRNVAIGRAGKTELINICRGCDFCNAKKKQMTEEDLDDEFRAGSLEEKRELASRIINRILRGSPSAEFCMKHTGMNLADLKAHLRIEGKLDKGWSIDHNPPRAKFTLDDIERVNHYSHLQITPGIINELKGTREIRFYDDE